MLFLKVLSLSLSVHCSRAGLVPFVPHHLDRDGYYSLSLNKTSYLHSVIGNLHLFPVGKVCDDVSF